MRIISSPTETSLISVMHGVAGVTKAAKRVVGVGAVGVGLAKGVALLSLSSTKASTSMVARPSGRLFGISYCFCLMCVEGSFTISQICREVTQISRLVKFVQQKCRGTGTAKISVFNHYFTA